jgi:hypothetical protein
LSDGCELAVSGNPTNCGSCGHSCFGGTCTNGTCQFAVEELYSAPQEGIQQIAVDGTSVYWTTQGTTSSHSLRKAPKTGGAATVLATGSYPYGLVVNGGFVYWTWGNPSWGNPFISNSHKILKTPVSGGTTTTLATDSSHSRTLSVDGNYVYWLLSDNGHDNIPFTVYSVPIGGGATQTLISSNDPNYVAQQIASGDTGNLCFAYGPYSSSNILPTLRVMCAGWSITTPYLHYHPYGQDVFDANRVNQLAYASGSAYWYNGNNLVQGTPPQTAGNPVVTTILLTGVYEKAMVGDPTSLLWFGSAPNVTGGYAICQMPLGGGTVKQLAPYSTDNITALASDGTYVYWTNGTYIRRAPKL